MKVLIPKSKPKKRVFLYGFVASLFIFLPATAALGDAIDAGLPTNTPQAVKTSTRQVVQNGLESGSVLKLTRAMQQNKFNEQQIQLVHALMIEAKKSGMPVQPLLNKAFEGMAKRVPPSLIVNAMETVQFRNAFAFQRAGKLADDKSRAENLGRMLAASLAAGLSKEDADKMVGNIQQHAVSMTARQTYSLALECFQTARDVSRLGVSSKAVTGMVTQALNKGFNHENMRAMRSSFMTQAQHSDPQNLAHGYTSAIQEGRGFQKGSGTGGGQSGGSSTGGSGDGGGAGSGGSGSGAGGGSGGAGSGSDGGGSGAGGGGGSGGGSGGSGAGSGGGSGGGSSGGSGSGSGGSGGSGGGGSGGNP